MRGRARWRRPCRQTGLWSDPPRSLDRTFATWKDDGSSGPTEQFATLSATVRTSAAAIAAAAAKGESKDETKDEISVTVRCHGGAAEFVRSYVHKGGHSFTLPRAHVPW